MLRYFFQDKNTRIENQIKDIEGNEEHFLNDLRKVNYLEIYEKSLSFLLKKADSFFGDRLLSFKAFDKHFALSLVYSFLFFLFSYVITGANEISHVEIMPKEDNLFMRILFFSFILFFSLLSFMFIYKYDEIIYWFSSIFKIKYEITHNVLLTLTVIVISGASFSGVPAPVLAGIVVMMVGITGVAGVVGIGLSTGIIGVVGISRMSVGMVTIGIIAGLLFNIEIDITVPILYYFFFPLVNAFFDFISTACSRYLAKKLLINIKERNHFVFMSILYFISDIIFAILAFFILATFLYFCFDLANYISISLGAKEDMLIPKEIYQSLKANFFGEYLWITIMLLSTFIPTIIHLVITSLSFISFISLESKNKHIISLIESNRTKEGAEEYINIKIRKKILFIILFIIISFTFLYFIDLPDITLDNININFSI